MCQHAAGAASAAVKNNNKHAPVGPSTTLPHSVGKLELGFETHQLINHGPYYTPLQNTLHHRHPHHDHACSMTGQQGKTSCTFSCLVVGLGPDLHGGCQVGADALADCKGTGRQVGRCAKAGQLVKTCVFVQSFGTKPGRARQHGTTTAAPRPREQNESSSNVKQHHSLKPVLRSWLSR